MLLEAPLPGTGTLDEPAPTARAELRERGFGRAHRPSRALARATAAPGAIERLLAAGDRLQVNASSLTGYHGAGARDRGARARRATAAPRSIASDAHRPGERAPSLTAAVAVLRRQGTPAARAEALVGAAPRALLEDGFAPPVRLAA